METVPEDDCPCWRLAEPIVDGGLPDHACEEAMVASVRSAMRDGMVPQGDWWPPLVDRRRLGLVIRQWVQDEPSRQLANLLKDSLRWQRLVAQEHPTFELWRRWNPDADLWNWVDPPARSARLRLVGGREVDPGGGRYLARKLKESGLPATPSTVRHLRAAVAGLDEPLPAKGLLVVTRVYVVHLQVPGPPAVLGFAPPHGFEVVGLLDLQNARLWDEARKVVNAHLAWTKSARCPSFARLLGSDYYLLTDPRALYHAHPNTKGERGTTDYLEEAMAGIDSLLEKLCKMHPDLRPAAVADHIKLAKDRVDARRKRYGGPFGRQAGWQREFRERVAEDLAWLEARVAAGRRAR